MLDEEAQLDAVCSMVEMRKCAVKALVKSQGSNIDVDEEFSMEELSDDVDYLDEQAVIVIEALIEAGYITLVTSP